MSALKPCGMTPGEIDAMAQAAYEEHGQVELWDSLVPHIKARWRRSIIAAWNRRAGDAEVEKLREVLRIAIEALDAADMPHTADAIRAALGGTP